MRETLKVAASRLMCGYLTVRRFCFALLAVSRNIYSQLYGKRIKRQQETILFLHIFSERLQGLMEGRFTQQELADEMGVSQPTVQRWVSGAMPRGKRLERLASALGVTVKELFAYGPSEPGSSGMELRERARPELDEVLSELAQIEEHVKRIRKKVQEMK